ncbi:Uncharacterised protein [Shigella sonnei]|nr:Uncharacterised protein [Shigella sonnei]
MGIGPVHVMKRHIGNHAPTDKVFPDKSENGLPCGLAGNLTGNGEFNLPCQLGVPALFGFLDRIPENGTVTTPGRCIRRGENDRIINAAFTGVIVD